ncbi:MAG: GNAT family N-acetyltransferase [Aggregatilineales bacterium]
MHDALKKRIVSTWSREFGLDEVTLTTPGTTLLVDEDRDEANWLIFWVAGEQVVIPIAPTMKDDLEAVLSDFPSDHRLSAADLTMAWAEHSLRTHADKFYVLDDTQFEAFVPDEKYSVRVLTPDDEAAFAAFQAQCTEQEREEGEISIGDEIATGVFDGERIVSGASMYEWRHFADIGVLVDPAYRKQGLGKAAVSLLCERLMQDERVVCYRHDKNNRGSQGVAQGLNLRLIATIHALRRITD